MQNQDKILLGHGSGGLLMKQLLDDVFFEIYGNNILLSGDDAAVFNSTIIKNGEKLAFSTDSFVVDPLFFPGGDIGKLAVCGTVNDISTSGAKPIALSVSFILEEGFAISSLKKICKSIAETAYEAGVKIVTGDTKVVEKNKIDGVFINTSGVGIIPQGINLSGKNCQPEDVVIVTGTLGDHGISIMSSRQGINFSTDIKSDVAPLNNMVKKLLDNVSGLRCFRDPTRGGLASTLNEFATQSSVDICVKMQDIPIKSSVNAACEMLGYDPLQVANEGKMVIVVSEEQASAALDIIKSDKYGKDAAIIGQVLKSTDKKNPKVYVETAFKTKRILDMLVGEALPRIC